MKTSDKQFIIAIGVIVVIIAAAIGAYALWSSSNELAIANANDTSAGRVVADQGDYADTETMDDAEGLSDDVAETSAEDEIDTSDWLTYTNEEYGFSFKYPREWVLSDVLALQPPSSQVNLYIAAGPPEIVEDHLLGLFVKKDSFDSYFTSTLERIEKSTNSLIVNTVELNIADRKAQKIRMRNKFNNIESLELVIEINDGVLVIACTLESEYCTPAIDSILFQ